MTVVDEVFGMLADGFRWVRDFAVDLLPSRREFIPCWDGNRWGECVLEDGHETWDSGYVEARSMVHHIDRHGQAWGVAAGKP